MKKIIICALFMCAIVTQLLAQTTTEKAEPRAINKGQSSVNLYYGTNLLGSIYKSVASRTAENLKVKSIGPVGLVYEYMITDIIGIGAEFGYSKTTLNYLDVYQNYNYSNGTYTNEIYSYELSFTTIRAMFRANFHFAHSEDFDAYGLLSAGYRTTTFDYTTSDPYARTAITYSGLIPFGVKPGMGFRYFFIKNVGVNIEIAAGTPLMCGGLSFKF